MCRAKAHPSRSVSTAPKPQASSVEEGVWLGSLSPGCALCKLEAVDFRFGWKLGLGWGQGSTRVEMEWDSDPRTSNKLEFGTGWSSDIGISCGLGFASVGARMDWGSGRDEVRIGWGSDPRTPDGSGFESEGFERVGVRIHGARMGRGPDVRNAWGSVGAGPAPSTHQPAGPLPVLPGE